MLSISDVKAEIEEVARDGAGNYLLLSRHRQWRLLSVFQTLSGSPPPRQSGLGVIFQGFGRPSSVPEGIEFWNYLVGKNRFIYIEDSELCAKHICWLQFGSEECGDRDHISRSTRILFVMPK